MYNSNFKRYEEIIGIPVHHIDDNNSSDGSEPQVSKRLYS